MVDMTRRNFLGGLLASLAGAGCSRAKAVLTEAQQRQSDRIVLADKEGATLACEVNDANPAQYAGPMNGIFKLSDKILAKMAECPKNKSVNANLESVFLGLKINPIYGQMFIRNYGAEVYRMKNKSETKQVMTLAEWTKKFQQQVEFSKNLRLKEYDKKGLVPQPVSDIFWRYYNNGQGIWRRNVSGIDKDEIAQAKKEAMDWNTKKFLELHSKNSRTK